MITLDTFREELERVRTHSPLVVCITNHVVMEFTADALLSIGARPFMSESLEEIEQAVFKADALLVNTGTLNPEQEELSKRAVKVARRCNVPWVLDPVGAGFTSYRMLFNCGLIENCRPTLIKGNASEIAALCSKTLTAKGTESSLSTDDVKSEAESLASRNGCIVALSGRKDLITDGIETVEILNGSSKLRGISGAGCILGAIAAAFLSKSGSPKDSVVSAFLLECIAAEVAERNFTGYGSFKRALLDELSHPCPQQYFNLIEQ